MAQKFKLQTVLDYRKILEDQAQQKLAETLQAQTVLEQQNQAIEQQRVSVVAQIEQKQSEGLSVMELQLFEDEIFHLRQKQSRLKEQLEQMTLMLNQCRLELMHAMRERKVIEKLKDKQLAEYLRKLDQKERILLDEISLRRKGDR
ncbi:MAG: flagellar export protein FliJ [Deltaproteobacteria bacterium]|nr:flagellar export protein FliJ [Deltaproteobacteria bacterium]NCP03967.1 flagellar export protein FliJ [Deltaproteobacteria bacterium]NCP78264.1 flagellar export protein FliJ [Desulfuromonadales bacterium]